MKKKWTLEIQKWILKVYFQKKAEIPQAKTMDSYPRLFKSLALIRYWQKFSYGAS